MKIGIYSRRFIQQLLWESRKFLSPEQAENYVQQLNRDDRTSLEYEWELLLLSWFAKYGNVLHEVPFAGSSRPDIYFQSNDQVPVNFLADISTVSDVGLEKQNPYQYFVEEFAKLLKKFNMTLGGFHIQVRGKFLGIRSNREMRLLLPPKSEIPVFIRDKLGGFVRAIQNNPGSNADVTVETEYAHLSISYNASKKEFSSGYHPVYTNPKSPGSNVIYNRLHHKAQQLSKANFDGPEGIFLCDGGCDILRQGAIEHKSPASRIIQEFFRKHRSVNFVTVLSVISRYDTYGIGDLKLWGKLFLNSNADTMYRLPNALAEIINKVIHSLPKPVATPQNALNHYNSPHRRVGRSLIGGGMVSKRTIKVSARALLELLAGKLDQETFFKVHNFVPNEQNSHWYNFFLQKLEDGQLIVNAEIERVPGEDDDWLVFHFGERDPAISPFRSQP